MLFSQYLKNDIQTHLSKMSEKRSELFVYSEFQFTKFVSLVQRRKCKKFHSFPSIDFKSHVSAEGK